jgi:hypothetical protein
LRDVIDLDAQSGGREEADQLNSAKKVVPGRN